MIVAIVWIASIVLCIAGVVLSVLLLADAFLDIFR